MFNSRKGAKPCYILTLTLSENHIIYQFHADQNAIEPGISLIEPMARNHMERSYGQQLHIERVTDILTMDSLGLPYYSFVSIQYISPFEPKDRLGVYHFFEITCKFHRIAYQ